jgi:hypothetical protein
VSIGISPIFEGRFQCGLRLPLFGDIHPSANVFRDLTGLVQDGMADRVQVLDRAVTKHNAVLGIELPFPLPRVAAALDLLPEQSASARAIMSRSTTLTAHFTST